MTFSIIHPREIAELVRKKRAIIIDVREREAYREYHYKNAYNCPYEEIEYWICRIPRGRAFILYCEHGSTSILAARRMAKEGCETYAVAGGIHAIRKDVDMEN